MLCVRAFPLSNFSEMLPTDAISSLLLLPPLTGCLTWETF